MAWTVVFHPEFEAEFAGFSEAVQDELMGRLQVLAQFGPALGRPNVDTLKGSGFPNLKELRFRCGDGFWRFAFAFDPERQAVILVGGDKAGADERRFYRALIATAERRFAAHVAQRKIRK